MLIFKPFRPLKSLAFGAENVAKRPRSRFTSLGSPKGSIFLGVKSSMAERVDSIEFEKFNFLFDNILCCVITEWNTYTTPWLTHGKKIYL